MLRTLSLLILIQVTIIGRCFCDLTTEPPYHCYEDGKFPDTYRDPCYDFYTCALIKGQWFYHPETCADGKYFDASLHSCIDGTCPNPDKYSTTQLNDDNNLWTTTAAIPLSSLYVSLSTEGDSPGNVSEVTETTVVYQTSPTTGIPSKTTTTGGPLISSSTTLLPTTRTSKPTSSTTEKPTKKPTTTKKPTKKPTTTKKPTKKPTTTKKPTKKPTTTKKPTKKPTTTKKPTKKPTNEPTTSTEKPTTSTKKPTTAPTTTTRKLSAPGFICQVEGYSSDPTNCGIFHACLENHGKWVHYVMQCPAGLVYCNKLSYCGWQHECPDIPCLK